MLQFHYTEWPCHSCPFSNAILEFRRRIRICLRHRAADMDGPIVVHCRSVAPQLRPGGGGADRVPGCIDHMWSRADFSTGFHRSQALSVTPSEWFLLARDGRTALITFDLVHWVSCGPVTPSLWRIRHDGLDFPNESIGVLGPLA